MKNNMKVQVEFEVEHASTPKHAETVVQEFLKSKGVVKDGTPIDREGKERHWGFLSIINAKK
jgi:GTP cyclohydrolase III